MTTEKDSGQELLNRIAAEVNKVVIGKEEVKQLLVVALLAQGHLLIEGLPGTAKTTLARTFAQVIGGDFKRVQGTPDMLPADIVGFYLYRPDGSTFFMAGAIFEILVVVDYLYLLCART
ncbi:MAG: MoxR family ATPase, partial [Dehalococcoidales bacterium]